MTLMGGPFSFALGWRLAELEQRRKGDAQKIQVAQRLRSEPTMVWSWIAAQLHMGAAVYAANHLCQP